MKIDKNIIKELTDYLNEFNLTEIEYTDKDTKIKVSKNNVSISYEAAIAGGIPIVKTVRENLKYNNISKIYGILNGTCNYILTKMEKEGKDFSLVLKDAQKLGFAELDPTFDIKGIDAAHKITLLSSLAFNVPIKFSSTYIEGVDKVELDDFRFAREFGYKIKLLGIAERKKDSYEQRVHPCLVKEDSEIAKVENELNAVVVIDDMIGKTVLIGPGAGGKPTAIWVDLFSRFKMVIIRSSSTVWTSNKSP